MNKYPCCSIIKLCCPEGEGHVICSPWTAYKACMATGRHIQNVGHRECRILRESWPGRYKFKTFMESTGNENGKPRKKEREAVKEASESLWAISLAF